MFQEPSQQPLGLVASVLHCNAGHKALCVCVLWEATDVRASEGH